jgi:hypothetical protein
MRVIVFLIFFHAIELVKGDLNVHHRFRNVNNLIKQYLILDWVFDLWHTFREGVFAADFLANKLRLME